MGPEGLADGSAEVLTQADVLTQDDAVVDVDVSVGPGLQVNYQVNPQGDVKVALEAPPVSPSGTISTISLPSSCESGPASPAEVKIKYHVGGPSSSRGVGENVLASGDGSQEVITLEDSTRDMFGDTDGTRNLDDAQDVVVDDVGTDGDESVICLD